MAKLRAWRTVAAYRSREGVAASLVVFKSKAAAYAHWTRLGTQRQIVLAAALIGLDGKRIAQWGFDALSIEAAQALQRELNEPIRATAPFDDDIPF